MLFWRKKGVGSQTFVRYNKSSTTYRIRAGTYEAHDPDTVPRILPTDKRGNEKEIFENQRGRPGERYKYTREYVHGIIGVGWKVHDDNKEDLEPLDLVRLELRAIYRETKVFVRWKNNKVVTLKDRIFVRRITKGSSLQGDRVIY